MQAWECNSYYWSWILHHGNRIRFCFYICWRLHFLWCYSSSLLSLQVKDNDKGDDSDVVSYKLLNSSYWQSTFYLKTAEYSLLHPLSNKYCVIMWISCAACLKITNYSRSHVLLSFDDLYFLMLIHTGVKISSTPPTPHLIFLPLLTQTIFWL